jgi:peptide/nickel transport system substrate-binding protein
LLAKTWKRIDDKTLEFKLRDDVKFHDGSEFDADDVIYTINYAIDPKNNFRFKFPRYGWIDHAEKIDKYTVRIVGKRKYAPDLERSAINLPIYPSDYHGSLKDKNDFGKAPIGTGPYKVVSVDSSKGVVMVKNEDYHHGGPWKPAGSIGRVVITPVPDRETQIARMLTGEQDLMYDVEKDQAEQFAGSGNLVLSVSPTVSFSYLYFDTMDKSGIHVFKDERVREAVARAINRDALRKALLPKAAVNEPLPEGMCHSWLLGCDFTTKPVSYDPEKAKKLLAEAGYPNGFDLELTAWGRGKDLSEAVAGELRKVGIKAKVDYLNFGTYNKKRNEGKVQTFVSYWDNGGAQADVNTTTGFFYLKSPRNYIGDPSLTKLTLQGASVFDVEDRKAIYRKLFDKVNKEVYQFPLIAFPAVMVHSPDLVVGGGHKSPEGFLINRLSWK